MLQICFALKRVFSIFFFLELPFLYFLCSLDKGQRMILNLTELYLSCNQTVLNIRDGLLEDDFLLFQSSSSLETSLVFETTTNFLHIEGLNIS